MRTETIDPKWTPSEMAIVAHQLDTFGQAYINASGQPIDDDSIILLLIGQE